MSETIGIIAGGGQFPRLVAQGARESGYAVAICGFHDHTAPELEGIADAFCMLYLGQFNKVIAFFRSQGVKRLCMAGAISKPKALSLRPDLRAAKLLLLRKKGDDSLLRAILSDLESEGFEIIPASSLATSLYCPAGVLTRRAPVPEELQTIRFGWPIAATLGSFDIGQCLVVKDGMVVAVECLEGTDATLQRGGELGGEGCIALKRFKPGQDQRVDLPAVGLETIRLLAGLKYRCLALEAQKTLFFDRESSLQLADAHNLCILALDSTASSDISA